MKRLIALFLVILLTASAASCSLRRIGGDEAAGGIPDTPEVTDIATDTPTEPVPADTAAETKADVITKLSFVGAGDNIVYFGNVRDAASLAVSGGRKYNFKPTYGNVANIIADADIAFINQETLMCGDGYDFTYYPMFNGPQDMGNDLEELGFDVVNIATNHMLDKGAAGLGATISFWKSMKPLMIGGYENEDDFNNIRIYEKSGVRIAFLAFTFSTNGITKASSSDIVIPYLDEARITAQVTAAKEVSDFVIVSAHWGQENVFTPNDEQKTYAKLMADLGIDAVIGHHPHVIQPIEWIDGKDGNHMLCVYSLGNFMAEMAFDYNLVGGFVTFDITKKNDDHATLDNVRFVPTVFHYPSNFYNNKIYLMENYTDALASSHGISFYGNRTTLARLKKYVTDTISPDYLPDFIK